jgi:uncharacterized protein (DUF1800 family)
MTSRFIPLRLLAYISRSPPPAQVAVLKQRYSCSGDLSLRLLLLFAFPSLAPRARCRREQILRNLVLLLKILLGIGGR